ncbi:MAG: replicative DNA helicase [Rhodospirillales bacterium]
MSVQALNNCKPGETVIYHTGFLAIDGHPKRIAAAARARQLAGQGRGFLTQRLIERGHCQPIDMGQSATGVIANHLAWAKNANHLAWAKNANHLASAKNAVPMREGRLEFRTLPHNVAAEKAVLGAVVIDNAVYERLCQVLEPEHFALGENGRVYRALKELIDGGRLADPVTLKCLFENDGTLSAIGGARYLAELAAAAVAPATAFEYALIVRDLALRRHLVAVGGELVERAYAGEAGETALELIADAERRLSELSSDDFGPCQMVGNAGQNQASGLAETMAAALAGIEAAARTPGPKGLTTGFADLDRMTGGLQAPDLIFIGGRPSMGKTALATAIALNAAAAAGQPVLFFSLEMSAGQLHRRLLSMTSGIELNRLAAGAIGGDEWPALRQAAGKLAKTPLYVDEAHGVGVAAIRSRAKRIKRKHGLGLVVIDYLQLIQADRRYAGQRVHELAEISKGLKGLAKELDVPVMALSQLSRAVEGRDDKRPKLADLRDSGSIEQDADIVGFVYRQEYYLRREEPLHKPGEAEAAYADRHAAWSKRLLAARGTAEIIIDKQRNGPTGSVALHFNEARTLFANLG